MAGGSARLAGRTEGWRLKAPAQARRSSANPIVRRKARPAVVCSNVSFELSRTLSRSLQS
jgi:hypothetical protein